MGDGLEDRYKYQTAHAKEEHRLALHFCEMIVNALVLTEVLHLEFAIQTA